MRGNADMSNVEEGGNFPLVPEDWYYAKIIEVKDGETKNKDYMANVKFNIEQGEFKESHVYDNIIISSNPESPGYKILGRAKHFLHCLGEPYEGNIEFDTDNWLWKSIRIKIFHDVYEGKKRAKVSEYDFAVDQKEGIQPDINDEDIPF